MTTQTTAAAKIEARIRELEATLRALVGCDEGTHGKPLTHRVYEEITGERYAIASFGGANGRRCTEEEAGENTPGRIIIFGEATKEIRGQRIELERLRKMSR